MHDALKIDALEHRAQIKGLEPDWQDLLARSDVASPFLTPGWQAAWLDTYGQHHRLYVLTARREGRLVGLWPLARIRRGVFSVLEPIGAGKSDWLDILTVIDERDAVVAGFLRYLLDNSRYWDLLDCRDVLEQSPSIPVLEKQSLGGGLTVHREVRTVAPFLSLVGSWEQYLASKRPKSRSTLKYKRRLAEREVGGFSIRRHVWEKEDAIVSRLAEVELRSWKAREGNLKVSTPMGGDFYRRFCGYFAQNDQLDLWRADVDNKLVAFLVNIRFGGKCYHYNTCFSEQFGQLSPGMLLHADAIADAFDRKLGEYDFLSGDEPFKERWSSGKRTICHLAMHSDRIASRGAFLSLVGGRWAFRRSARLRRARQALLSLSRKAVRRFSSR